MTKVDTISHGNALQLVITAGIGVTMLALSPTLMPSNHEIGIMHYRDKEFERALTLFEDEYNSGIRNTAIIVPLARLHIQNGDVEGAVRLMEEIETLHPNDPITLHELGRLYQFAQRPLDYARTLEKLRKVAPTENTLRELSHIYNFRGEYQKQINVLQEMVTRGWATSTDIRGMAYLYAARGEMDKALKIFESQALKGNTAINMSKEAAFLRLNLLIDTSPPSVILGFISAWRGSHPGEDIFARLLSHLDSRDRPDLMLALLRTEAATRTLTVQEQEQMGYALTNTGQFAEAYALLSPLLKEDTLTKRGIEAFAISAVRTPHLVEAVEALEAHPEGISSETLFTVLEAALLAGARAEMHHVLDLMQDSSKQSQPILMARVAHALGETTETEHWLEVARLYPLRAEQHLDLVAFEMRLGKDVALSHLLSAVEDPNLQLELLPRAAGLFLQMGESSEGIKAMTARLRQDRDNLYVQMAEALARSSGPNADTLRSWLDRMRLKGLNPSILKRGYDAASETQQWGAAVAFAESLYAIDSSVTHLAMMVEAATALRDNDRLRTMLSRLTVTDPATAERLSALLLGGDYADLTLSLLAPWNDTLEERPGLLVMWARASLQAGHAQAVFDRLRAANITGSEKRTVRQLIALSAISINKWEAILAFSDEEIRDLPPTTQSALIRAAIQSGYLDDATDLLSVIGWNFLDTHPLLGAEYALLNDDHELAFVLIEDAASNRFLPALDMVRLSILWQRIGEDDKAFEVLHRLTLYPMLPKDVFPALARQFYRLGHADVGLKFIEGRRAQDQSPPVTEAWLILATAEGQEREVQLWLDSYPFQEQDRILLRDLYYTASETGQPALSYSVATKLWTLSQTDQDRMILAQANLENGKVKEALALDKKLPDDLPGIRLFRLGLMFAAVQAKLAEPGPLIALLQNELPSATKERAKQIIYDLHALGAYDTIRPYLASTNDIDLQGLYIDVLQRIGDTDALEDVVTAYALNPLVSVEERRNLAFLMLDKGNKSLAETIFITIAEETGPLSKEMDDLRYLWGPRASEESLQWLRQRVLNTIGYEQGEWLRLLSSFGGENKAEELISIFTRQGRMTQPLHEASVYVFHEAGHISALRRAFTIVLRNTSALSDTTLQDFMIIARDRRMPAIATGFGETILDRGGDHPETLRILGGLAYQREDYQEARKYLMRYLAKAPEGDFESNFYMGEIEGRESNYLAASNFYQRSLKQIEALAKPPFFPKNLRGLIFQRLERYDEAIIVFQRLLHEAPNNDGLRADLAETLLLKRDSGRARDALFQGRRR